MRQDGMRQDGMRMLGFAAALLLGGAGLAQGQAVDPNDPNSASGGVLARTAPAPAAGQVAPPAAGRPATAEETQAAKTRGQAPPATATPKPDAKGR